MPSFRYGKSIRDQEIKKFLEKQNDKSEIIKEALYLYIHPEKNELVAHYIDTIKTLTSQNELLQKLIVHSSETLQYDKEQFVHVQDIKKGFQLENNNLNIKETTQEEASQLAMNSIKKYLSK